MRDFVLSKPRENVYTNRTLYRQHVIEGFEIKANVLLVLFQVGYMSCDESVSYCDKTIPTKP